jgi:hypothetical protein
MKRPDKRLKLGDRIVLAPEIPEVLRMAQRLGMMLSP